MAEYALGTASVIERKPVPPPLKLSELTGESETQDPEPTHQR